MKNLNTTTRTAIAAIVVAMTAGAALADGHNVDSFFAGFELNSSSVTQTFTDGSAPFWTQTEQNGGSYSALDMNVNDCNTGPCGGAQLTGNFGAFDNVFQSGGLYTESHNPVTFTMGRQIVQQFGVSSYEGYTGGM